MVAMKTPATLLAALLTGSWLVACGSVTIDAGAGGRASVSGSSTGAGGDSGSGCGDGGCQRLVSTGNLLACAVTAAGAARCWGWNVFGGFGDNTTKSSATPVDVVGLSSGVRSISVAEDHTCAVTSSGAAVCWGSNQFGALGTGSTDDSLVPVGVVGLSSGVIAVSAGGASTCALTSSGAVKCWGRNANGQLGDGTTNDSAVPVDVVGLSSGVVGLSSGLLSCCAITSAGAVQCWGWNSRGELGNGSKLDSHVPVNVIGLSSGVLALSSGDGYSCAIVSTGAARCWGFNSHGQLGNNSTADSPVPVDVIGLPSGLLAVSAGYLHTCAITADGALKCWGRNFFGALGNDSLKDSLAPVDVVGLSSGVVAVSPGTGYTCAITGAGAFECWGPGYDSELSTGSYSTLPVEMMGL